MDPEGVSDGDMCGGLRRNLGRDIPQEDRVLPREVQEGVGAGVENVVKECCIWNAWRDR